MKNNKMKKLLFIATVLLTVLSFSSCNEDEPVPMIWEFSDYNSGAVSVTYSPDFVNQAAITADSDFSGDITLKCTNYSQLMIDANNNDGSFKSEAAGCYVRKIDGNTLKITFDPIVIGESWPSEVISVDGKNGKNSNVSNIYIGRIRNDK